MNIYIIYTCYIRSETARISNYVELRRKSIKCRKWVSKKKCLSTGALRFKEKQRIIVIFLNTCNHPHHHSQLKYYEPTRTKKQKNKWPEPENVLIKWISSFSDIQSSLTHLLTLRSSVRYVKSFRSKFNASNIQRQRKLKQL